MSTDEEIVIKFSTPGLKRNMLSRYAKAWHLRENYRMTREERDALLAELYATDHSDRRPK